MGRTTCRNCVHEKRCPERSRGYPCRDYEERTVIGMNKLELEIMNRASVGCMEECRISGLLIHDGRIVDREDEETPAGGAARESGN